MDCLGVEPYKPGILFMRRKALSFYHGTLCASHINIFISLQPVIRKHALLYHISCIYPKGDFRSMSLGLRRLRPGEYRVPWIYDRF